MTLFHLTVFYQLIVSGALSAINIMTKFNKGDRFRCDSVEKDAIFTIIAVNFINHRSTISQIAEGLPMIQSRASYTYSAVTYDEDGKPSKIRVFGKISEPIMIAV